MFIAKGCNSFSTNKNCYTFSYFLAAYDEIYREVSLAHLLTLVDIPMLDQILSYEHSSHKQSNKSLTFSNLALSRYPSLNSLLSDS